MSRDEVKKPDPRLLEVLKRCKINPRAAVWPLERKGKVIAWIIKHQFVEMIGAHEGVVIDPPTEYGIDLGEKRAWVLVRGRLGERQDWTFGEAATYNLGKGPGSSYPLAMAEKRAKDRLVLKLVGLHGLAYSSEEADFEAERSSGEGTRVDVVDIPPPPDPEPDTSSAGATPAQEMIESTVKAISDATSEQHLKEIVEVLREQPEYVRKAPAVRDAYSAAKRRLTGGQR